MSNSRKYAKKKQHEPIYLPQGELPWFFFPKVLQDQDDKCFIPHCIIRRRENLVADHDHSTGELRGFLCDFHNSRFMAGIDDFERHGTPISLPFEYPAAKYYHPPAPYTRQILLTKPSGNQRIMLTL